VLWVDASYENTPDSPHHFGRFNAHLGKLKAERKSWTEMVDGVAHYHKEIAARGFDRRTPIIYTIHVDSRAANREEAVRVFQALVSSFRTIAVRP
jgi:hypothetical protein